MGRFSSETPARARRLRAVEQRLYLAVHHAATGGGERTVLNASGYVTARRRATVSSKVTGKQRYKNRATELFMQGKAYLLGRQMFGIPLREFKEHKKADDHEVLGSYSNVEHFIKLTCPSFKVKLDHSAI